MRDIMIDIETLGTTAGSVILSIAAVAFDAEAGTMGEEYQANILPKSASEAGLTIDIDTVAWWMTKSDEARSDAFGGKQSLQEALTGLGAFVTSHEPTRVWSKPISFDLVILEAAYRILGLPIPWHFRTHRDLRAVADFADFNFKSLPSHVAIKILDPHRLAESILNLSGQRIIWLDRDSEQQALSQVKFMRLVLEVPVNRKGARGVESTLRQDTTRCHRLLSMLSVPVLRLPFEHLITHPTGAAQTMAAFLAPHQLDVDAMARVVVPRSTACRSDMLELSLLDGAA